MKSPQGGYHLQVSAHGHARVFSVSTAASNQKVNGKGSNSQGLREEVLHCMKLSEGANRLPLDAGISRQLLINTSEEPKPGTLGQ